MSEEYTCVIKGEERPDDGMTFEVSDDQNCQGKYCPDCGGGMIVWDEAGNVPWHRLCTDCGSQWDARDHRLVGTTTAEMNAHPNLMTFTARRARLY